MVIIQEAVRKGIRTGFTAAKEISIQSTGYDFVGLTTRILVFYVVALVIAKVMELIIFSTSGISTAARLFGIPLPNTVPEVIRKLFVEGYNVGNVTIKWWDLIKIISVLMVVMEMLQYMEHNKIAGTKPAPTTLGVFTLIIAALALISVPSLVQMIREKTAFSESAGNFVIDRSSFTTGQDSFDSRDIFGRR